MSDEAPFITELLSHYDRTRTDPKLPGLAIRDVNGVTVFTGHFNFVSRWSLRPQDAQTAVANVASSFTHLAQDLQWSVYDHDQPDLSTHLLQNGFVLEDTLTLMMAETATVCPALPDPRLDIRQVADLQTLDDYLDVGHEAFGPVAPWQKPIFSQCLDHPGIALFVAYRERRPAAAGRLDMDLAASVGTLFGGGVSPPHRRQGLYTQLVAARARHAQQRGIGRLAITARETSRPILARLGFHPIGRRRDWWLRPTQDNAAPPA